MAKIIISELQDSLELIKNEKKELELKVQKEISKPENTILIVITDISSLAILNPPYEADIVVGDIQTLGIPMSFGGPHAGFMACKEK